MECMQDLDFFDINKPFFSDSDGETTLLIRKFDHKLQKNKKERIRRQKISQLCLGLQTACKAPKKLSKLQTLIFAIKTIQDYKQKLKYLKETNLKLNCILEKSKRTRDNLYSNKRKRKK